MRWVWHLNNDCIDHRDVGTNRHSVIEEPSILQTALVIIDIFLVKSPTDALHCTALVLALNVTWMDGLTCILNDGIPSHPYATCFSVYIDINNVCTKTRACTLCIDRMGTNNRAPRLGHILGDFLQRQWLHVVGVSVRRPRLTINPLHIIDGNIPELSCPIFQCSDQILCRTHHSDAPGKSYPTAASQHVIAQCTGINDHGANLVQINAQFLGRHHG